MISSKYAPSSDSHPGAKQFLHRNVDKKIIAPASDNIPRESVLIVQSRNGDLTRKTLIPCQFVPKGITQ